MPTCLHLYLPAEEQLYSRIRCTGLILPQSHITCSVHIPSSSSRHLSRLSMVLSRFHIYIIAPSTEIPPSNPWTSLATEHPLSTLSAQFAFLDYHTHYSTTLQSFTKPLSNPTLKHSLPWLLPFSKTNTHSFCWLNHTQHWLTNQVSPCCLQFFSCFLCSPRSFILLSAQQHRWSHLESICSSVATGKRGCTNERNGAVERCTTEELVRSNSHKKAKKYTIYISCPYITIDVKKSMTHNTHCVTDN